MAKKQKEKSEVGINRPVYLKRSRLRVWAFWAFSVLTAGVVSLIFYWFDKLQKHLYVRTPNLEEADHVLVITASTKQETIVRLNHTSCRFLPNETAKWRYYFNYKKHLYYIKGDTIQVLHNKLIHKIKRHPKLIESYFSGLSQEAREDMERVYMRNLIEIEAESVFLMFLKEFFSPYTIFQLMAIAIWAVDDYMLYAYVIIVMMALTIVTAVYEKYTQSHRMNTMTYTNKPVQVLTPLLGSEVVEASSGMWMSFGKERFAKLMSIDLAIGDIIRIDQGDVVTADVLLLRGKCLMNEAMLTGETVPVSKRPFVGNGKPSDVNIVYAGTECIMKHEAIGLVINTGFYTKKGEIIRTLLFTERKEFKFKTDAFKLLGIIFLTVFGFFIWFVLCIENSIYFKYYKGWSLLIKGAEMFTVAVPPVLPLAITIGLEIASQRLRRKQIYSLFLDKINQAGRVKLVCFDKTGTLTQNLLNFRGVLPIYNTDEDWDAKVSEAELAEQFVSFSQFYTGMEQFETENTISPYNRNSLLYECMACCHNLELHNGELIGDPIEIQLFNQTAFSFESRAQDGGEHATVICPDEFFINKMKLDPSSRYVIEHTFDFTSERKRMSVIVSFNGKRKVLMKGAPEVIKSLCFSQNLPFNYDEELAEFTEQGFRVIALAYRDIDTEAVTEDLERGVRFIGFVVFENPLKDESKETIATLTRCGVRSTIVTGDNLLTAMSVGISLRLFNFTSRVFIATLVDDEVSWDEMENENHRQERGASMYTDETSFMMSRRSSARSNMTDFKDIKGMAAIVIRECFRNNCVICITGDAFEHLFKNANMRRKTYQKLLNCMYIFARTSPRQKALIVSKYQEYFTEALNSDWFVGFCGDGANDSEALKQADVSVSLSNSEAVLAATFNTTRENISCVVDLFIEAKCSLETSLQNAKFVLFYSLLQFLCVLMVYMKAEEFNNMAYFTWDIVIFVPLSVFMNRTRAVDSLNSHNPETSLLNKELMVSLFGQLGVSGLFIVLIQTLAYSYSSNLEIYEVTASKGDQGDSLFYRDTQGLIFYASLLTIWSAVFFSRGYPFKLSVFTNKALIAWVTLCTLLAMVLSFSKFLPAPYWLQHAINRCFRCLTEEFAFVVNYVIITFVAVTVSYLMEKKVFSRYSTSFVKGRA